MGNRVVEGFLILLRAPKPLDVPVSCLLPPPPTPPRTLCSSTLLSQEALTWPCWPPDACQFTQQEVVGLSKQWGGAPGSCCNPGDLW